MRFLLQIILRDFLFSELMNFFKIFLDHQDNFSNDIYFNKSRVSIKIISHKLFHALSHYSLKIFDHNLYYIQLSSTNNIQGSIKEKCN